jgi:hypothetical protein
MKSRQIRESGRRTAMDHLAASDWATIHSNFRASPSAQAWYRLSLPSGCGALAGLQNTGDAPLIVETVSVIGAHPNDFTVVGDGWTGAHLLPGQIAKVAVAEGRRFESHVDRLRCRAATGCDAGGGSTSAQRCTDIGQPVNWITRCRVQRA